VIDLLISSGSVNISDIFLTCKEVWVERMLKSVLLARYNGSAHNPSYSGSGDQEDHSLTLAQAKKLRDPTSQPIHLLW
jgi:hypothetical protein